MAFDILVNPACSKIPTDGPSLSSPAPNTSIVSPSSTSPRHPTLPKSPIGYLAQCRDRIPHICLVQGCNIVCHFISSFFITSQSQRAGPPSCHAAARGLAPLRPQSEIDRECEPLNSHNSSTAAPRRGPAIAALLTARKTRPPALSRCSCQATCPSSNLTAHPDVDLFSIQNSLPFKHPLMSGVPRPMIVSMLCQ